MDERDWWNANLPGKLADFERWVAGPMDPSRCAVREIVRSRGYRSMLDCGCGTCATLDGFIHDGYAVDYTGIDTCGYLVERMAKRQDEHVRVLKADIELLPFPDKSFDVVLCRDVLEHLDGYWKAMDHMLRVAKNEVMVSWFLRPCEPERLTTERLGGVTLRHNWYSRNAIEKWLADHNCAWTWTMLPGNYELLRYNRKA